MMMEVSGTATVLPALLSEGFHKRNIQVGFDADLAIVDLDLEETVIPEMLNSVSDFSIYDGWTLKGWPTTTMIRGKVVVQDGKIVGEKWHGNFVARKPS